MFTQHLSTTILLVAFVGSAYAQDYPAKPIRIISPFAVGGSADAPARWIAAELTRSQVQQFIADSRSGASAIIGTDLVAKSSADGYTLLFTTVFFISSGVTAASPPFGPVRDCSTLPPASNTASMLVVGPALPVNSMRDLLAHARTNPGKMKYASS